MFSVKIFKQCLRGNVRIWAVITLVMCLISGFFITMFDPKEFGAIAAATTGSSMGGLYSNMSSILGTVQTAFRMMVTLLGTVWALLATSNLVVSEVDSGSLAYTLSTPVRRSTVIITKLTYFVASTVLMFAIVVAANLATVQLAHHSLSEYPVTADVEAAADAMDRDPAYVAAHLYSILDDKDALHDGAQERNMDEGAYRAYLEARMLRNSYKAAARELTANRREEFRDDDDMSADDIEVTEGELAEKPQLMLEDDNALKAGAELTGESVSAYRARIQQIVDAKRAGTYDDGSAYDALTFQRAQAAAAKALDVDVKDVSDDLALMTDGDAMRAAMAATGLSEGQLTEMLHRAMVSGALSNDAGLAFDMETYLEIAGGTCLLILAFGGIGFFASCAFDRTGPALALGGGLPFAFFLMSMVVTMGGSNTENLKYLTLTTLNDTGAMLSGDPFAGGLIALGAIAAALYTAGCAVFCKKDLPL